MKYPFSTQSLNEFSPDILVSTISVPAPSVVRRTRFKLWELQSCWHCMVIGTCLSLDDVSQCASRAAIQVQRKSDYDLHQLAVECAANKQHPLTQQLQKRLERRYASSIKLFRSAKNSETLSEMWTSGWKSGEVAGSLWALITNPMVTRNIILEVFGEVHMMSHLSGASHYNDRKQITLQEKKIATLSEDLNKARQQVKKVTQSLDEKKYILECEQANCRKISIQLEHAQLTQTKPEVKTDHRKALVDNLRGEVASLRHDLKLQQKNEKHQSFEIDRLQRALAAAQQQEQHQPSEDLKLCGQCVLYLGGKANQRRHFQELVESCDGRFLHHDGGREVCPHRISELVSQADVVMCPTDCISHSAMEKARTLCAKQDKPIIFMQRASLSTFTKSLHQALG